MLTRWAIPLIGPSTAEVPVEAPHAVFAGWLDHQEPAHPDTATATEVDHDVVPGSHWAAVKPYAVSAPRPAGHGLVLGVRLLHEALGPRLIDKVHPGDDVRLGRHTFKVTSPPACTEHAPWPRLSDWAGARAWQVRYRTPTAFRRRNRSSPWPAPESIIAGLLARWRQLAPLTAPHAPQLRDPHSIWVADLDGRSEAFTLGKGKHQRIVSGFVGTVRYLCDGPDPDAAAFDRLLAFAAFAGIGSHTGFGLGEVQIVVCDSHQPR